MELNQTKSANARTDGQTDELMRCGLFHWKWERIMGGLTTRSKYMAADAGRVSKKHEGRNLTFVPWKVGEALPTTIYY